MSGLVSVASSVQHVVVGWKNEDGSVEPISHEPTALITNAKIRYYMFGTSNGSIKDVVIRLEVSKIKRARTISN